MDESLLSGSAVRTIDQQGRLLSVRGPWIRISWEDPGQLVPREAVYLRSDPFLDVEVEILTLSGWKPLGDFIGASNEMRPRVRDHKAIFPLFKEKETLESDEPPDPEDLAEAAGSKLRSPFKTASKTFIGPRGGWFHKYPGRSKGKHMNRHKKRDIWDCSSEGPYKQTCVATKDVPEQGITKGQVKKVSQPAKSKSKYNKEYKAFHAASMAKASSTHLKRQMKAKEKLKAKAKGKK